MTSDASGAGGPALGLDADLLEILACPAEDHGPLVVTTDAGLRCTVCGRRFPVTDGIPVLLLSEATGGPDAGGPGGPGGPAGAARGV